ncbi:MAG: response regulator [Chloroflexales bacterium]|nr:response regulator [Chloroflexales bacterium]
MQAETVYNANILIVDDQEPNLRLLEGILEHEGYRNIVSTTDSQHVLALHNAFQPDLILLDLLMPGLDGFALLEQLGRRIPEGAYLPIVVLTANITAEAKRRALALGATDFLTKPLDAMEVLLRIWNVLETRFLYLQQQAVQSRFQEDIEGLEAALTRVAQVAEAREFHDQHAVRVSRLTARIAQELDLPPDAVERIRQATLLHDLGKAGLPPSILDKPGPLTATEFDQIATHTTRGAALLQDSSYPLLQQASEIARSHHEYWDGNGYPAGLQGEAIPLSGRIVAVAEAFDVLTNDQVYRRARPPVAAATEIVQQQGKQFDPKVVEALVRLLQREGVLE